MPGILQSILKYRSASKAAKQVQEGYSNAIGGVLGSAATSTGAVNEAGAGAQGKVNTATGAANTTLQEALTPQQENLSPYLATGNTAATNLQDYIKSAPKFSFTPGDLTQEPGYQFQLGQGQQAIENSASSRGLLQSGNTLKDLTQYGQGLAGTYYQNAFNRAQQSFQTNQNTTLANLMAGVNTGLQGTEMYNQATQNATNKQAQNTLGAGYFGGQTDIDLAQFLANLNMGAAKTAGGWAIGKGEAAGAGTLGKTAVANQGIEDIGGLLRALFAGGGG